MDADSQHGLRLLVFDRTCRGRPLLPGLSHAWGAGRHLYRALGRIDASFGATSWLEALGWLATLQPGARLAEVQYWGHGNWGNARIAADVLDERSLSPGHPHHDPLVAVGQRLRPGDDGLWWFRTCETFGTEKGQRFAARLADFLGCRVAGHTHVIGFLQSGLHSLLPGEAPDWPADEGVRPGAKPAARGRSSSVRAPGTITCLHGRVPRREEGSN